MKIAVITGASSGMGREFVCQMEQFYRHLDEIWVIARRKNRLEQLRAHVSTPLCILDGDLLEEAIYEKLTTKLQREKPDVRILVNSAGFGKSGTFLELGKREPGCQLEMIDMNCRALTRICGACLPYMSRGSRIINLASAAAFSPQASFAVYAASKAYVLSFSAGIHEEVRKQGICVTSVCPGPVKTEFFTVSGGVSSKSKEALMAAPEAVVKQAFLDAKRRRTMSVYGGSMKGARILSKLLPQSWIVRIMARMR